MDILTQNDVLAEAGEWQAQREILAAELREDTQAEGWLLLGVELFE